MARGHDDVAGDELGFAGIVALGRGEIELAAPLRQVDDIAAARTAATAGAATHGAGAAANGACAADRAAAAIGAAAASAAPTVPAAATITDAADGGATVAAAGTTTAAAASADAADGRAAATRAAGAATATDNPAAADGAHPHHGRAAGARLRTGWDGGGIDRRQRPRHRRGHGLGRPVERGALTDRRMRRAERCRVGGQGLGDAEAKKRSRGCCGDADGLHCLPPCCPVSSHDAGRIPVGPGSRPDGVPACLCGRPGDTAYWQPLLT